MLKIKTYQGTAFFRVPNFLDFSYPLPPFSTVAGMISAACGWEKPRNLRISVAGEGHETPDRCYRWEGRPSVKSDKKDRRWDYAFDDGLSLRRTVHTTQILTDLELVIHIASENDDEIAERLLHPTTYLSLGRWEDLLRVESVQQVSSTPNMVTSVLPRPAFTTAQGAGVLYPRMHKRCIEIDENGLRQWEDVSTEYCSTGTELQCRLDSEGNPIFLF